MILGEANVVALVLEEFAITGHVCPFILMRTHTQKQILTQKNIQGNSKTNM